jgi:hypothetical protein
MRDKHGPATFDFISAQVALVGREIMSTGHVRARMIAGRTVDTLDLPAIGPAVSNTEAGGPLPKSYVRLTHPLVRDTRGGELRQATWDEALDRTVAGLQAALAKRASDQVRAPVGIFSCSKATNEVNYAAQKLSRVVLGSNNIDSCNRT